MLSHLIKNCFCKIKVEELSLSLEDQERSTDHRRVMEATVEEVEATRGVMKATALLRR